MKNVVYFDPETFQPTEHEFSDYQYNLTRKIREFVVDEFDYDAVVSSPVTDKEGTKIMFGVMRNRHNGEEVAEKYKITIEKISDFKMKENEL